MGGIIDEFGNVLHTAATDVGDVFSTVTDELGKLGIYGIPAYVIQLLHDDGKAVTDIPGEIMYLYQVITSGGVDFLSSLEQFAEGSIRFGSPQAYVAHEMQVKYNEVILHIQSMVTEWQRMGQIPVDMLDEIDKVLKTFGTDKGTHGATTEAFVAQYTVVRGQILQMSAPMASSPWDGKNYGQQLQDHWGSFTNQAGSRLAAEVHEGTLGLRGAAVILLGVGVVYACIPIVAAAGAGTPFTFGGSAVAGGVLIAGISLLYICISMWILNILDLFVTFLAYVIGMLIDMIIVEPVNYLIHEVQLALAALAASKAVGISSSQCKQNVADGLSALKQKLRQMGLTDQQIQQILNQIAQQIAQILRIALSIEALVELLSCMGLDSQQVAEILTTLTTSNPINTAWPVGGMVTGSDSLASLLVKTLQAAQMGQYNLVTGGIRMLINYMALTAQGIVIKGMDVHFKTPSGDESDADFIDNQGNVYEVGGSSKLTEFDQQDQAITEFIRNGGTGNTNGDINLLADADSETLRRLKIKYQGEPNTNLNDAKNGDYGWSNVSKNKNYKRPKTIQQKNAPNWQCGSGKFVPTP